MATYEIKPNWGDEAGIRKLLAEQSELDISLTETGKWYWGHKFVFTGSADHLNVWRDVLADWSLDKQMNIAP